MYIRCGYTSLESLKHHISHFMSSTKSSLSSFEIFKWLTSYVLNFPFFEFVIWQAIDEFDQNVYFIEIDIEEDPEIAAAAGIMATMRAIFQE